MTEPETYGFWVDAEPAGVLSHQRLELNAAQLAAYWRRCSLSADFWSHYTALFVAVPPPAGHLRRSSIKDGLSYLLNELFENCAKFSNAPISAIQYNAWIREDLFSFQITNHVTNERSQAFADFVQELLAGDPEELYFRRLEEQAETNAPGSGLGYLSLIKDYGVRFGFRFRQITDTSVAVDVQAHISRKE